MDTVTLPRRVGARAVGRAGPRSVVSRSAAAFARAAVIVAALLVGACGTGGNHPSIPAAAKGTVGPAGGSVAVDDARSPLFGARVEVAAGALTRATPLALGPGDPVPAGTALLAVGPAVRFTPSGTTFASPAKVTLPFDPAAIPEGFTTDHLVIARYDERAVGGPVDLLPVVDLNRAASLATTLTEHFTTLQVMVNRSLLTLFPAVLPVATAGLPYAVDLPVSGSRLPYAFALAGGQLPPGLTLDAATGRVSGSPQVVGTFTFTVTVSDTLSSFEIAFNKTPGLAEKDKKTPDTSSREYTIAVARLGAVVTGTADEADVATDSAGRVILADLFDAQVRVRRFQRDGAAEAGPAGAGLTVSQAVLGEVTASPRVAVGAQDAFAVVWEQRVAAGDSAILARVFDAALAPTAVATVSDNPRLTVARLPAVAAEGAGFFVVWEDLRNQDAANAAGDTRARGDVFGRALSAAGVAGPGAAARIDASDTGASLGSGPEVAAAGATLLVGWREIGSRTITAPAVTTTTTTTTGPATAPAAPPTTVTVETRDLLVRAVSAGVPSGTPQRVNAQTVAAGQFSLAGLPGQAGGFLAAFQGVEIVPTDAAGNPLAAPATSPATTTTATTITTAFPTTITVNGERGTCTFFPASGTGKNNTSLCGKYDPPQDKVYDENVYLAAVSAAGAPGAPRAADDSPVRNHVYRPCLAPAASGRVLLTWDTTLAQPGDFLLLGRRFTTAGEPVGQTVRIASGFGGRAASFAGDGGGYAVISQSGFGLLVEDDPTKFVAPPLLQAEPSLTPGAENSVTWTAVAGAKEYRVEVSTDAAFTTLLIPNPDFITATTFTATTLIDGQTYFYRAVSRNEAGTVSVLSNVVFSRQDATKPTAAFTAPAAGTRVNAGARTVVRWTTTDTNVGTAKMEFAADGAAFKTLFEGLGDRGVFDFDVPAATPASTTALLRLTVTDRAGNAGDPVTSPAFEVVNPVAPAGR
ncbi:MAG: putative Ig domain-containing protein [Planctomycetes bacterium]|nr:putative Ig domain-containing protein [Planctomycetota bacterium]